MRHRRNLALSVVLAAMLAAGARAQPPSAPRPAPRPAGVLFISPAGEPFRAGADMTLSMKMWFDQADANHDGALSPAEFLADHMRAFRLYDQNGDGFIDGGELRRYENELVPEVAAGYDGRSHPIGPRGAASKKAPRFQFGAAPPDREGAARYSALNEPEPLSVADTDVDFRISEGEWQAAAKRRFALLDRNHDGKIVFSELELPPEPWRVPEPPPPMPCSPYAPCPNR